MIEIPARKMVNLGMVYCFTNVRLVVGLGPAVLSFDFADSLGTLPPIHQPSNLGISVISRLSFHLEAIPWLRKR